MENLFKNQFKNRDQAESIRKGITNKNTEFDRLRRLMIRELQTQI